MKKREKNGTSHQKINRVFLRLRQKAINYNDISQSARNKRLNSRNAVACLTARSLDYLYINWMSGRRWRAPWTVHCRCWFILPHSLSVIRRHASSSCNVHSGYKFDLVCSTFSRLAISLVPKTSAKLSTTCGVILYTDGRTDGRTERSLHKLLYCKHVDFSKFRKMRRCDCTQRGKRSGDVFCRTVILAKIEAI